MTRLQPRSTRTDTLLPCTTLFRSCHAALRLRQREAAVDEAFGRAVPFADDVGVGAARAQRDEAPSVVGREAVGAVPDPALLFAFSECIDVDQRRPDGLAGEKIGRATV